MNMSSTLVIIVSVLAVSVAQRSPYARRPVGYPVLEPTTQSDDLGYRFGNGVTTSTTTQRLPVDARGDRELVDQLSKLPPDQQPFWLLNWRALEDHKKEGHTYQHRPSNFIDSTSGGQTSQNMEFF